MNNPRFMLGKYVHSVKRGFHHALAQTEAFKSH